MNNRIKGRIGEDIAEAYYRFKGYQVVDRNFHSHFGELDLILKRKSNLKFVEVKSIWYEVKDLTALGERVNWVKIRNIKRATEKFFNIHPELMGNYPSFEVLFLLVSTSEIKFLPYSSPLF